MTSPRPDIGVWLVALDGPRARALGRLATLEDARRAACRPDPVERARYLSHRGWLRVLLGRHLGVEPGDVVLRATPAGQPYVLGSTLSISASHSRGQGLYAISRDAAIGVDVQWHDPGLQWPAVMRVFGNADENAGVTAEVGRRGPAAFYDWWCRKEAVLKARGHGLHESLRAVPVNPPTADQAAHCGDGSRWALRAVAAPPGFSAALAWSSG